ncbi:hypothetical protein BO71DRAFT_429128 [Aspergillus ellipticus CBS 707.79]|uniref:F-box domain-containing protein n=1 Tax=Aspergillus ellipticus CBS 707.79 TaxID=1448320 RepID=A0A319EV99_9EURO|nr:hypothetical protein BO71DRAFT_429128 [Aspergillus ellipticus CBS 707.79]
MSSFLSLPLDVVRQICDHLANDDFPSIYDLALVNKDCYRVANRYRFRHIYLTFPVRTFVISAFRFCEEKGRGEEIAIYQAIKKIPLTDLSLTLDCRITREGFQSCGLSSLGNPILDPDLVRDMFINVAVDSILAEEIFLAVSQGSLQHLKLDGGGARVCEETYEAEKGLGIFEPMFREL